MVLSATSGDTFDCDVTICQRTEVARNCCLWQACIADMVRESLPITPRFTHEGRAPLKVAVAISKNQTEVHSWGQN